MAAPELYSNGFQTTLNGAINNSVTTLTLTSITGIPSGTGQFRLLIDSEILVATLQPSGSVFTVIRGSEGTTAASHSNGATVTGVISQGTLDQFRADSAGRNTQANRPSAALTGRLWLPSDSNWIERDNSSSWDRYGPIYPITAPPLVSAYSWVNQNVGTASDTNAGLFMSCTGSGASEQTNGIFKTIPSAPYTIIAGFQVDMQAANFFGCALALRESSTGKQVQWQIRSAASPPAGMNIRRMTNPTTFSNEPYGSSFIWTNPIWLKITDDNTNRKYFHSFDGINYFQDMSEGRTAWTSGSMTPNQVGFALWTVNTGWVGFNVFHYSEA